MTNPIDKFLADFESGEGFAAGPAGDPPIPDKYQGKSPEQIAALQAREDQFNRDRQGQGQQPGDQQDQQGQEPLPYDRERAIEIYGEGLADQFEAAGLNPFDLWQRAEQGRDIPEAEIEAYAKATNLPASMVDRYVKSFVPPSPGQQGGVEELHAALGGVENAQRLKAWADQHALPGDIERFNSLLAAGDMSNARGVLQDLWGQMQASTQQPAPPAMIRGNAPGVAAADAFSSHAELEESLMRLGPNGRRLYNDDPRYRAAHDAKAIRSGGLYQ